MERNLLKSQTEIKSFILKIIMTVLQKITNNGTSFTRFTQAHLPWCCLKLWWIWQNTTATETLNEDPINQHAARRSRLENVIGKITRNTDYSINFINVSLINCAMIWKTKETVAVEYMRSFIDDILDKEGFFHCLSAFVSFKPNWLKVQSCKLCSNKYLIAPTQITNTEIFAFLAVAVFKLLSRNVLFINNKYKRNC